MQSLDLVRTADSNLASTTATVLKTALQGLRDLSVVGDVRGLGLLWGVEFVRDKKTKQPFPPEKNLAGLVGQAALSRGLLVYPMQGCVDESPATTC